MYGQKKKKNFGPGPINIIPDIADEGVHATALETIDRDLYNIKQIRTINQ